jgi:hypothetical protein
VFSNRHVRNGEPKDRGTIVALRVSAVNTFRTTRKRSRFGYNQWLSKNLAIERGVAILAKAGFVDGLRYLGFIEILPGAVHAARTDGRYVLMPCGYVNTALSGGCWGCKAEQEC